MAKVEDMRSPARRAPDRLDAAAERIPAGDERQGIEIALRCTTSRELGEDALEVERPIEGDRIADLRLEEPAQIGSAATHEYHDPCLRTGRSEALRDRSDRVERE